MTAKKRAAFLAQLRIMHQENCEQIALDKKLAAYEAEEWRVHVEHLRREEAELAAMQREHERTERMRRQYREAVLAREAMIDSWFSNVRNGDIAQRVRELAKNAGPKVLDFVEYKAALKKNPKRRKRDRLGIL